MYRIMVVKSKRDNYGSLFQFMTTTIDGVTVPFEINTKEELDARIEKMLNTEGYSKDDFIVVQVVDYNIDVDIVPSDIDENAQHTPIDIALKDNRLWLTTNGEAVGNGVELPKVTVDSELSDVSENPVQNKAVAAALSKKADAVQYFEYAVSFLGKMGFSARFDRNIVVYKVEFGYWRDGEWNPVSDIPCPKTEGTPDTGLKILSAPVPSLVSVRMPDVETETPENQWTPLSLFSTELGIPVEIKIQQDVNGGGYQTLAYLIRIDFNEFVEESPDEVLEMGNYLLGIDRIRIAWEDFFEPVVYE